LDEQGRRMWTYDKPGIEESIESVYPGTPRTMVINLKRLLKTSIFDSLVATSRACPPGMKVLKGDSVGTLGVSGAFK
jgi:hypothetical protein